MSGSPIATHHSLRDALAHAKRIDGYVNSYAGFHRVYVPRGQPVQDGARSPAERRYDRELTGADRLADFHDRELNAAVELFLARTREAPSPESGTATHHGRRS